MVLVEAVSGLLLGLVLSALGLQMLGRAFERLAGAYLKVALHLLTSNRFAGVLVGAALSFPLSSASKSTSLLAVMGDAGLLGPRQTLSVLLGVAIGTSLAVQLVAFDLAGWALYLLVAGFLVRSFSRRGRHGQFGAIALSLGLLFLGLRMMNNVGPTIAAALGARSSQNLLSLITVNPFYVFLLGIALAAVLQSSVLALALAFAVGASVAEGIPLALGASVGVCAAGLFPGLMTRPAGRQVALGHVVIKLLTASFFMLILLPFTAAVELWSLRLGISWEPRIIAHANTLYSLLSAVILLPLLPVLEQVVLLLVRGARTPANAVRISAADLDDPAAALAKAKKQVVSMGRTALLMLRKDLTAFLVGPRQVTGEIAQAAMSLDACRTVLPDFLCRIDESRLSAVDNQMRCRLLHVIADIGRVSATVSCELVPLALRKSGKGVDFSVEGSQQFESLHRLVADDLSEALDVLEGLPANPQRVLANAARAESIRQSLMQAHVRRVSQRAASDTQAGAILLDAVAALRTIHYHVCDMVCLLLC